MHERDDSSTNKSSLTSAYDKRRGKQVELICLINALVLAVLLRHRRLLLLLHTRTSASVVLPSLNSSPDSRLPPSY